MLPYLSHTLGFAMPAHKTSHDELVLLPTRMPRIVVDYLHLIVQLERPDHVYRTVADLQVAITTHFLALAPYPPSLPWRIPQRAAPAIDTSPRAYRQVNFQVRRDLAERIDKAAIEAGVTRAVFLYTATRYFVEQVAPPAALGLT